ncbi:MAG TPA: hypothetical protein VFG86_09300, partial [Chloroflexota bacterium]|nr:hypothetical protein [Chloroflexota bacterium]
DMDELPSGGPVAVAERESDKEQGERDEQPSAWDRNRELSAQAAKLRIRAKTLRNDTPLEEVEAYNRELGEQIEAEFLRRAQADQNRAIF